MDRSPIPAVLACTLALGAIALMGSSSASALAPAEAAPATAVVASPQPAADVARAPRLNVKDLATITYSVVGAIVDCEKLSEQIRGCPQEKTISFVSQKLKDIEAQITRNQARTEQALDMLQKSLDGKDLADAVVRLSPIESHISEAAKAWEALSDCANKAQTAGASCTGYNGRAKGPIPVYEGMRISRAHFLISMDEIGLSVGQAATFFAGTRSIRGVDGFLHALWKSAKREQDRASGVTVVKDSLTPTVITRALALEFLPTMTYYRDMIYLFGALKPAAMALRGMAEDAESEANIADAKIFAATDRWTVAGASDFYNIPDLPPGSIAYVKDGKLHKIVEGEGKGSPLPSSAVRDLGALLAASGYQAGPNSTMALNPQLLPHGGLFAVHEKVKHRTHLAYNRDGKGTNPSYAICADRSDCSDTFSPYNARKATFEIGHPEAVGTRDRYGNIMKMRWTPMLITSAPMTWGMVIDSKRWSEVTGNLGAFRPCYGEVMGEPPSGVFDVQFLETFRRLMSGTYATFAWDCVGWTHTGNNLRNVGPGVYLMQGATQKRFALVERTLPGILAK